jgi:precorrin-6Y C5,15-methyltransferase (decarboxylating)
MNSGRVVVVGIGADGWSGLGERARQLTLLPIGGPPTRVLPAPLEPLIDELVTHTDRNVCVLASGDPMLHGIGVTLARRLAPEALEVIPHPSAFATACARLGWPEADVTLVSIVARPPETIGRWLQPRRKLIAYVTCTDGAATIAKVLRGHGYGSSHFVVMEQLGGSAERLATTTAAEWGDQQADPLHAVAIECLADPERALYPLVPGLPDDAYETDGQLTKRHVRAATLAMLSPTPDALLWDVGGGSGSIAIEWLRAEPTARAITIEVRSDRARRIARNALRLGVPALQIVTGEAPEALTGLPQPDAVFIGGGVTTPGLIDHCWDALAVTGRFVANAVTLEGEQTLFAARARYGGELTQIAVSHAAPVGDFTAWRPALPVSQWSAAK